MSVYVCEYVGKSGDWQLDEALKASRERVAYPPGEKHGLGMQCMHMYTHTQR